MDTTTTTTAAVDTNMVAAKTICLALTRGRFGNKRRASMSNVTVDADKSLLSLSKILLDSPELQDIQKLDSSVQSYLRTVAFKSMFKGGVYLIPVSMVQTIIEALEAFAVRREALVDVAVSMYPTRIAETKARLAIVGSFADYPSTEKFRSTFTFEWRLVTFDTPTRLKAISAELFKVEQEKAAVKMAAVADECRDAMRAGLATMIDRLVERLTPDADGKKKTFTQTAVTNINEFLDTFELRNVTDDAELASVVAKARAVMSGVDVKTLRTDDQIRAGVLSKFTDLASSLQPMTIERGSRAIEFDDEE